jgi:hypothetical protein
MRIYDKGKDITMKHWYSGIVLLLIGAQGYVHPSNKTDPETLKKSIIQVHAVTFDPFLYAKPIDTGEWGTIVATIGTCVREQSMRNYALMNDYYGIKKINDHLIRSISRLYTVFFKQPAKYPKASLDKEKRLAALQTMAHTVDTIAVRLKKSLETNTYLLPGTKVSAQILYLFANATKTLAEKAYRDLEKEKVTTNLSLNSRYQRV